MQGSGSYESQQLCCAYSLTSADAYTISSIYAISVNVVFFLAPFLCLHGLHIYKSILFLCDFSTQFFLRNKKKWVNGGGNLQVRNSWKFKIYIVSPNNYGCIQNHFSYYLLYLKGAYYYHFWAKCKLLYIYVPCTLRCAFLFNMPFSETIQTSIKCKRVFKKAYTKVVSESALFVLWSKI